MGPRANRAVTSRTFGDVDAEPEDSGSAQVGAQPVELDEQTWSEDVCLELRPMFAWAGRWPPHPTPRCFPVYWRCLPCPEKAKENVVSDSYAQYDPFHYNGNKDHWDLENAHDFFERVTP